MIQQLVRWREIARSEPVTVGLLVAANAVPLFGVLFLGWDVFFVLFVYWLENGIVGVFNVPRIALAALGGAQRSTSSVITGAYMALFFPLHYGGFWVGHGLFVMLLTGDRYVEAAGGDMVGGALLALAEPWLLVAALGLFASHGAAFALNYVGRREYLRTTASKQMQQPYPRLVILHLTILFGGFAIALLGSPVALVAILVLGKTVLDLSLYFAERTRAAQAAPAAPGPAPAVTV